MIDELPARIKIGLYFTRINKTLDVFVPALPAIGDYICHEAEDDTKGYVTTVCFHWATGGKFEIEVRIG